ncbi:MAG: hypothetical protein WB615_11200 [Candidatus Tumulicola sp.]
MFYGQNIARMLSSLNPGQVNTEASTEPSPVNDGTPLTNPMEEAVRQYYVSVRGHDFATAYSLWSPSMQRNLTADDLARQFQATTDIDATISDPPSGNAVGVTVIQSDTFGDYVRKRTFKGTWRVSNVGGHWLLDGRDFKTVVDTGPPPNTSAQQTSTGASEPDDSSEAIAAVRGHYERTITQFIDTLASTSGFVYKPIGWKAVKSRGRWTVTYALSEDNGEGHIGKESFIFTYDASTHQMQQIGGAGFPYLNMDNADPE